MLYILFVIILVVALLIAFEAERQRRAKHRASTSALLSYVASLPNTRALERVGG